MLRTVCFRRARSVSTTTPPTHENVNTASSLQNRTSRFWGQTNWNYCEEISAVVEGKLQCAPLYPRWFLQHILKESAERHRKGYFRGVTQRSRGRKHRTRSMPDSGQPLVEGELLWRGWAARPLPTSTFSCAKSNLCPSHIRSSILFSRLLTLISRGMSWGMTGLMSMICTEKKCRKKKTMEECQGKNASAR